MVPEKVKISNICDCLYRLPFESSKTKRNDMQSSALLELRNLVLATMGTTRQQIPPALCFILLCRSTYGNYVHDEVMHRI